MVIPKIDVIQTGKNIKNLRQEKNLTVKELQSIFGFSSPYAVYKWENGLNLPTIDNLVILAKIFDTKMDNIIAIEKGLYTDEIC